MNLKNFNFSLPDREELAAVRMLAEINPELLDGRDIWIYREFLAGDGE